MRGGAWLLVTKATHTARTCPTVITGGTVPSSIYALAGLTHFWTSSASVSGPCEAGGGVP